jgi:phospholipase C
MTCFGPRIPWGQSVVLVVLMSSAILLSGCGGALGAPGSSPPPASSQVFTISGNISGNGVAGTTVVLSGAASANTTADSSGNYSFNNLSAGAYTVTPNNPSFTFTPPSQNLTITNANVTANFSSTGSTSPTPGTFSISGNISGPGGNGSTVALSGTASSGTVADASGNYSFSGLLPGSYTVTPMTPAFSFAPTTQGVTITNANVVANFSSASPPENPGIQAVNHIIFLAQENRSFDSYFGKMNDYRRSAGLGADVDGLPDDCSSSNSDWTVPCSAMNKSPDANGVPTTPVYAFHLKGGCIEGLSPDWTSSHWDFNAEAPDTNTPAMDGFLVSAASAALTDGLNDKQGIRAMGFYTGADLPYHYWLATQFATSDRWFSPAPARTQPNRYYMVGATSGGHAYPSDSAINAKTIFDLLDAAGVSWLIYSQDGTTSAAVFAGFMSRYPSHIVPLNQFASDAQAGTLPSVAYIEKPDADEKPNLGNNIQSGVAETRFLIEPVLYGPSWPDSVMIFTFDEGGGMYDHVAPPTNVPSPDGIQPVDICTGPNDPRCAIAAESHSSPPYDATGDFTRYGFRVPLAVISPFTRPNYVSHTVTDYTSWMKFVETRFGLPHLNARDADGIDMTEFFNFQNPPLATAPQNPPSDISQQCYDGLP